MSQQARVELRCAKCPHHGRHQGRLLDTVWFVNDRIRGIQVETDLADQIEAHEAGVPYETPAWMGSSPYNNECSRCGNRPKLKIETLTDRVREAARTGVGFIYI